MIYVSHRLDEVFEVADEVAVLRDGRLVGPQAGGGDHATRPGDDDRRSAAGAGVRARARPAARAVALELRELQIGAVGPVSLTLRAGRDAGPGRPARRRAGAGRPRPVRAGRRSMPGPSSLAGATPDLGSPGTAMRAGIGLVAGDRTAESLAMPLSVRENLFLNPAANGRRALRLAAAGRRAAPCESAVRAVRRRPATRRDRPRRSPAATSRRWSSPAGSRSPSSC